MKLLCATVLLSIVVATKAVQFVDCGSKDCKINSLDVSNCAADATSCDFPRGSTVNMTLKFTTTTSDTISSLTDAIAGYVGGIWVPFKKTDVCNDLSPSCPLKTGTAATYILTLTISNDYPQISVPVKSNMTDSTDICTCFEIQGKIV